MKPLLLSSRLTDPRPTLRPLATPAAPAGAGDGGGRLLLLPTVRSVAVVAERTGRHLATVLANREASAIIECLALAPSITGSVDDQPAAAALARALGRDGDGGGPEHTLLLGCSDGTIRQVSLAVDRLRPSSAVTDCGSMAFSGACLIPHRTWKLAKSTQPVVQISMSPSSPNTLYALIRTKSAKKHKKHHQSLFRVTLPLDNDGADVDLRNHLVFIGEFKGSAHGAGGPVPSQASKKTKDKDSISRMVPYFMSSTVVSNHVLIVLASPTALYVYYDDPCKAGDKDNVAGAKSLEMTVPKRDSLLTAVGLTPTATHVALGYQSGEIHVLGDLLPLAEQYLVHSKGRHPARAVLIRKLHWHAHPVSCLAFSDTGRILYSGGEESVLVTWQLERGTDRPSQVLPRVAMGAIQHIMELDNRVTLLCRDNSMQLLNMQNQSIVWKHQGLAMAPLTTHGPTPILRYSSGETVQLIGCPLTPGYMHWYDTRQQVVVRSLEITPINRISRAEPDETPMPAPNVTHAAFSRSGKVLVTCELVPTENSSVGYVQRVDENLFVGMVPVIRFWSASQDGRSYELSAAMAYPHGTDNPVSSLAVSEDGNFACSVSNDENAFRVWRQVMNETEDGQHRAEWVCQYKVSTPAGYARQPVRENAVAFSSDASVIAIAYGCTITLWDRKEMALLGPLQHGHADESGPVVFLKFLDGESAADLLLTSTSKSVCLQSPFGGKGPSNLGWTYQLNSLKKSIKVTCVDYNSSHSLVILSLFHEALSQSRVLCVDTFTGEAAVFANGIPSHIVKLVSKNMYKSTSLRNKSFASRTASISLFALTLEGELIALRTSGSEGVDKPAFDPVAKLDIDAAPRMPLLASLRDREDKRSAYTALDLVASQRTKKVKAGDDLDQSCDGQAMLDISFARAFLARHLQR